MNIFYCKHNFVRSKESKDQPELVQKEKTENVKKRKKRANNGKKLKP